LTAFKHLVPVERPYLRDGVDVYVRGESELHFVFLATRKRLILKAQPELIQALAWLDGTQTRHSLRKRFASLSGPGHLHRFDAFLEYLEARGIVVDEEWIGKSGLDESLQQTQRRQLTFLLDMLESPAKVAAAQVAVSNARIACFGVGAVGGWLIRMLIAMGFRHFLLIDHALQESTDASRHAWFDAGTTDRERTKVTVIAEAIREEFNGVNVLTSDQPLTVSTHIGTVLGPQTDLVINAADEPYIGYTSVLLSRYCIPHKLPLLVAGGFDAHLGSLGEMIIPGITPCADCYADHFSEALADWKPISHPVEERRDGSGGLCSLAVFAAAAAAMKVLRLIAMNEIPNGGRGELLFDSYRLESFNVERRPNCRFCASL
jgi:molybdopterin/thiamine biosynthesis adenylyltransferase